MAERLENLKSELNDLSKLEKEAPNNLNNINDNAIRSKRERILIHNIIISFQITFEETSIELKKLQQK